jgi:hypothetical protein
MKKCSGCKERKALEEFTKYANAKDGTGTHNQCKKCSLEKRRFRAKNPVIGNKRSYEHLKKVGPNIATVEMMQEMISYNKETGKLTWKKKPKSSKIEIGDECGRLRKDGYREICLNKQHIKSHRAAWAIHHGVLPDGEIDHKDGDKTNNSIDNLRIATKQQNSFNKPKPSHNTSGYRGVAKYGNKWMARIKIKGVTEYLGTYEKIEDAAKAYAKRAKEIHGEFFNKGELP